MYKRQLLAPSLLNVVVDNLRKGNAEGRLFELSNIYIPKQQPLTCLLYTSNSPCDYMRNFPTTHPYMKLFEKADKFIMCCGQGAWAVSYTHLVQLCHDRRHRLQGTER